MASDLKYGEVTISNPPGTPLGDDEPVVLFRATDKALPDLLVSYHRYCQQIGSPQEHLDAIGRSRDRVIQWQLENPDKVSPPD